MCKLVNILAAIIAAALAWTVAVPRLLAQAPANATHVWTGDMATDETAPQPVKELKPVTLIGARNGTFSCKVVAESTQAIKGLKASVTPLTGSAGTIPAANVQLRYAKPWDGAMGVDMLLDSPPEVAPNRGRAFLTVWVTVTVPKDAKPGAYTGTVTVHTSNVVQYEVKFTLDVADWTLPDAQDFRTWTDFVESPDTLALEYKVPLWSDQHWKLIDNSFRLLSPTGCRVLYVPLITGTNFGNEQSMVRWIKKPDGTYDYDYSVLEKYLDSAQKNMGTPKLIIIPVWDIYMSLDSLKRGLWNGESDTRTAREDLLGKGPRVTVLDPVTKEAKPVIMPRYEDPASKALWQPMFAGVIKRIKARGLEKTMMLGTMPDLWPNKEEVTFWKDISGGLPWVVHAHGGPITDVVIGKKALYKIADIGYAACVNSATYSVNPDKGRNYGWNNPAFVSIYQRFELNHDSPAFIREFEVFNLTGNLHGAGRMGGDLWPVLLDKQGKRSAQVYSRYPENNWRNLDIRDWILAPGPDAAVPTARLEYLREGIEVCEARIFLEAALLNPAQKAQMGDDLAQRCQDALDAHQRAMWKTTWNNDEDLKSIGNATAGRNPWEALYQALLKSGKDIPKDYWHGEGAALRADEAKKGQAQFVLGWQDREKTLYALAGEVAAKLRAK
jgi:hypothetical protein